MGAVKAYVQDLDQEQSATEVVEEVLSLIQKGSQREFSAKETFGVDDFKVLEKAQWVLQSKGIKTLVVKECGQLVFCVFDP